jgi:hypothetical protein
LLKQVLPLVPPEEEFWSPYTGLDALCGSTLVISLDELVTEGLLEASDLPPIVADGTADFFAVRACMPPPISGIHMLPQACMPCCRFGRGMSGVSREARVRGVRGMLPGRSRHFELLWLLESWRLLSDCMGACASALPHC